MFIRIEQTAGGIDLYVNTKKKKKTKKKKTELIVFKIEGIIRILGGKLLKIIDPFKYLGSNISSTLSDVNM